MNNFIKLLKNNALTQAALSLLGREVKLWSASIAAIACVVFMFGIQLLNFSNISDLFFKPLLLGGIWFGLVWLGFYLMEQTVPEIFEVVKSSISLPEVKNRTINNNDEDYSLKGENVDVSVGDNMDDIENIVSAESTIEETANHSNSNVAVNDNNNSSKAKKGEFDIHKEQSSLSMGEGNALNMDEFENFDAYREREHTNDVGNADTIKKPPTRLDRMIEKNKPDYIKEQDKLLDTIQDEEPKILAKAVKRVMNK